MQLLAGAGGGGNDLKFDHRQRRPLVILQLRVVPRHLRPGLEHHLDLAHLQLRHQHDERHLHGLPPRRRRGRLLAYLLAFLAAMLGLVLADNVITLFVFWEATSVVSFLLIGFDHGKSESRAAAVQALLFTGAGGLALLAGLVLAGLAAGEVGLDGAQAWRISAWAAVDLRQHPTTPPS